jgi:hypothetical protein
MECIGEMMSVIAVVDTDSTLSVIVAVPLFAHTRKGLVWLFQNLCIFTGELLTCRGILCILGFVDVMLDVYSRS